MSTPERKEFWGTSEPSLLASVGLVVSVLGAWLWLTQPLGVAVALVGLIMIAGAIGWNVRKGFDARWRKVNVVLHAGMFVLGTVAVGLAAFFRAASGT